MKLNGIKKKDGSLITPFQIHGRIRKYPQLFQLSGSFISLIKHSSVKQLIRKPTKQKPVPRQARNMTSNTSLLEAKLMNEKNFKNASVIDGIVSPNAGLYCIRIKDKTKLPAPFNEVLFERGHNIIYIGIATTSLSSRFLRQELRAKGHGTFFRSMGAVLGHRPVTGSLLSKVNKRNYKFSRTDELKIIEWINSNLVVNWIEMDKDVEMIETTLLQKYQPLLNIAKNPAALAHLSELRAECVRIANDID